MAMPLSGAALPLTPGTIQSIIVPLSAQATPSVAGSSSMLLFSMLPVTQVAGPPMPLIKSSQKLSNHSLVCLSESVRRELPHASWSQNMTADFDFVQTLEKSMIKQNLIHFPYPESQTA